jgi:hypothetical protein
MGMKTIVQTISCRISWFSWFPSSAWELQPRSSSFSKPNIGKQSFQDSVPKLELGNENNIHAREYQLYLPNKEELRRKLEEWAGNTDELSRSW